MVSPVIEAQKAREAQKTKRAILTLRTREGRPEKVTQNLSLEGCMGYRVMEVGVKGIPGNCIKKGRHAPFS